MARVRDPAAEAIMRVVAQVIRYAREREEGGPDNFKDEPKAGR